LFFSADTALRRWLQAPGSLTARLRCFGLVQVVVQQQGRMALWPQEQADLQQACGYVREVVLLVNGRPAVWARSATARVAVKGPWRAMRGLGTRPLAELLFSGPQVLRGRMDMLSIAKSGAMHRRMRQQWQALQPSATAQDMPQWARSSVFWRKGQGLRVMEAFAPWVCALKQPYK
jgi:chorismate--pyruvate lyase